MIRYEFQKYFSRVGEVEVEILVWFFDGLYRMSVIVERMLDCGVVRRLCSVGVDRQSGGKGVELGDIERIVCLEDVLYRLGQDFFRYKSSEVYLIFFKFGRDGLDYLRGIYLIVFGFMQVVKFVCLILFIIVM